MKTLALTLLLAALSGPALAQTKSDDHAGHRPAVDSLTDGEVRKIDKDAKKLTIKHGPIKNLDMPAMTMVFQVKDTGALDKLAVGDKIRFVVQQSGSAYVVTEIQAAK